MSMVGMPSVMQMIDRMPGVGGFEDRVGGEGAGTKISEQSALISRAPRTVLKTGTPSSLTAAAGRHASDDLRAVVDAALRLKAAFTPGDALHEDARGRRVKTLMSNVSNRWPWRCVRGSRVEGRGSSRYRRLLDFVACGVLADHTRTLCVFCLQ